MFLQRIFKFRGVSTVRIVLLIAIIGTGRIAYAKEVEQQSPETINEVVAETVEQVSSESIDEIIVYGDKPLHSLRREVYRAEENFFDLFSSLNEDDDYDVRCYYEVPSFTHIRRHVCRAKFVIDATSAESAPALGKVGAFSRPAVYEIRRKREILRERMEALIAERPELALALIDYTKTKQILESEKERRYGK
jgi:hypothetical protein